MSFTHPVMIKFRASGDMAVLVELGREISPALSRRVYRLFCMVEAARPAGYLVSVPAFNTLLVQFDPLKTDTARIQNALLELIERVETEGQEARTSWRIPVCYDPGLAPDLERAAQSAKLSIKEYADCHSQQLYTVYMLGGFPGFPYMGQVPQELRLPRLTTPRLRVEAGSVAIASDLTAIYPAATPGGWNIVGRTPIRIFDLEQRSPALISPGDDVHFVSVSMEKFGEIEQAVSARQFDHSHLRFATP
jgi:KipI family sensor histidine kinase inhibitor